MNTKNRVVALVGGSLLAAGLAVGPIATVASAAPGDRDRGDCTVRLVERGDTLRVQIRSDVERGTARVNADFDRGRDDNERVGLNGNGDATARFDIPRNARRVTVTVRIRDGRDLLSCDSSIRVNRPEPRAIA